MHNSDDKEKFVEDFSFITEAINQILVKVNCPDKFRQYIYCLIGIADKNIEFEASDSIVAASARGRLKGGNTHANKEWARDKRRELIKWQDEGNLKLLTYELGKFDSQTKKRSPSKYILHLLEYAERVVAEAQRNKSFWGNDRVRAIQQATDKLVTGLLGQQVNAPQKRYIDPPSEVKTKLRTASTNLKVAAGMLKKYDFKLMREDEKLIEEIENSIKEIRDRGFVDDVMQTIIFSGIERD